MIHPLLCNVKSDFYPRSPCGERRQNYECFDWIKAISIHALLAESDAVRVEILRMLSPFLSTLSLRRATLNIRQIQKIENGISIHALLAESDKEHTGKAIFNLHFYPRSPCGERQTARSLFSILLDFYPRSPCGERHANLRRHRGNNNFYPRSPCGERHLGAGKSCNVRHFYPRSPCGERQYAHRGV